MHNMRAIESGPVPDPAGNHLDTARIAVGTGIDFVHAHG
jgi:hypothetical protein